MVNEYDVIISGAGTMGIATAAYLAASGARVLAIDQYTIPNDLASHSGYTRIIRKAYYEHPDYVPLLLRSYELWNELEIKANKKLYHQTGILYLGPSNSTVLNGCLESSKLYNIPVEQWTSEATRNKYPQFQFPNEWLSLWEPEAGYLDVNESIASFYKTAIEAGAEIHSNEKVISWNKTTPGILVHTDRASYSSKKIIFTSGAWTDQILAQYTLPLKVTRQSLVWLDHKNDNSYTHPSFPCWFIHDPEKGMYYGFPDASIYDKTEPNGIKVGLHVQGIPSNPESVNRNILPEDDHDTNHFIEHYMPTLVQAPRNFKTCMYTNTPDEHFIIDTLPETDQRAIFACGFSGHGFKFAPVIGEILAQMALNTPLKVNIEFLKLNRFMQSS